MDSLGRNITLPIYNANGTSFHGLELKKFTFDSVVMALGDKITGELYYPSNTLSVNQTEYVVYDGVKYYLINPPTIVKEGMKADNGTAKGMTKYSFTFYHPMFMLYNFPFTDVAVTSSEEKYKSQDKNFFWIGNLVDYVAKLNKNLTGTEWVVEIGSNVPVQDKNKLSEVLSFNDKKIADALKTGYDTWEIPYIIDIIASTDSRYAQGKRFLIRYGLPSQEILVENAQHQNVPYVFQMGQGVGLKNDSRTPKNNKIITRIAGYGSEDNVPFGYPQIIWTGDQTWNYTINNSASAANSYPIYDGIVAGQRVRLIHHPFTRSHLMPTIYADTVNKKVNPYASGYDPTIEIKDYYDAVNDSSWTYPNQIISNAPSYEIHEFSDIKPELGEKHIVSAEAFNGDVSRKYMTVEDGVKQLNEYASETNIQVERLALHEIAGMVDSGTSGSGSGDDPQIYWFEYEVRSDAYFTIVTYASSNINFILEIHRNNEYPSAPWDDSMDDDGNYKQSYFRVTLPSLGFDLYACAAVTQEMKINMRSGACLGCSFPVEVDWEDYKKNFYDSDGNFAPYGQQRNFTKYPNSTSHEITVICKKELDTFGTLMPNIYQQPAANDKFVILGISLPQSYITSAQTRLDNDMKQYMLDNNVHYFEYPLKFDEYFLANHTNILAQMKPNILVRFNFASEQHELYIKQISVKYGEKPLPQYNITLTDDIEIVLSPIGRVTDEVSSLRVLFGGGGSGSGDVNLDSLSEYFLSKQNDDTAAGMIRFLRGLQVGENFVTGLLGEGGIFRVDDDGTTYLECDKLYVRMRAYFDTVEVKKYLHSGGNRIASKAGINCSRVEWIDANGDATNVLEDTVKFRCYFRATSENGREITNDFVVNDLAFCKETNVDNTSIQQHGYWRCVVGVSSSPNEAGEHWIDLSKTDCQTGSDVPLAQDDIIQLGHKTDNTRQGAIVEFVGGEDAPAYQIYQGINSYSLTGKNYVRFGYDSQSGGAQAYIGKPDGTTYIWYHNVTVGGQTFPRLDIKANVTFTSPEQTYGTNDLNDFIDAVTRDVSNIHSQIDGEIDTWFYDYSPVTVDEHGAPTSTTPLNVAPYSEWDTEAKKEAHLGDIFYNTATGYAFRFEGSGQTGNRTYSWGEIQDSAVITALENAKDAYDLADNKRRVFVAHPTPPYDEGDLWANATYPSDYTGDTDAEHDKYHNDLLRCNNSKASGAFDISDWELASKYTSDAKLNAFLNGYTGTLTDVRDQIDKKAETWYLDRNPESNWYNPQADPPLDKCSEHVGDLWYCTADIDSTYKQDTTWYYKKGGTAQNPTYTWQQQNIPKSVFDTIDTKKAIYTTWGAWVVDGTSILEDGDLYIPSEDHVEGSGASAVTYKTNNVYKWNETANEWQKTEDQELLDFLNGYGGTLQNYVKTQVDKKAETWVSSSNPATAWYDSTQTPVYDVRDEHVGDMWLNSGKSTIDGVESMQTAIYTKSTSNNTTTYGWIVDPSIPNSVFDTIDGKKSIYVSRPTTYEVHDMWIIEDGLSSTYMPTGCQTGDIVISSASRTNNYKKADWSKKDRYTDDTRVNNFVNEILNGTGATGDDKTVADAIKAVNDALYKNTTTIDGGLILSSLIALKNNGTTYAGISGIYDSSAYGNGIAAWYGGGKQDRYNPQTGTFGNTGAKTVFRMDGSGYVASGNIFWDASGNVTIQGYQIKVGDYNVATTNDLSNYVTTNTDQTITGTKTFQNRIKIGDIYIGYDSTNNALKVYKMTNGTEAAANLYATGAVSAFGIGTGGGGGTVSLCAPLDNINNYITQLPAPNLDGVTFVWNKATSKFVYSTASGAKLSVNGGITAGAASSIKGSLSVKGNITVNGGGFVKSDSSNDYVLLAGGGTKLLSEIGGGSYLPLSGGTMTGTLTIGTSSLATQLTILRKHDSNGAFIEYSNNSGRLGLLGFSSNGLIATLGTDTTNLTVWHSGNFTPSDYVPTNSTRSIVVGGGNYNFYSPSNTALNLDSVYGRVSNYTSLGASSTNIVDLDTITTPGDYTESANATVQNYVLHAPVSLGFRLNVSVSTSATRKRQRFQVYSSNVVYERQSNSNGSFVDAAWTLVQSDLSGYVTSSALRTTLSDYALASNVYSKTDVNGFTWWGQSLSNGAVSGDMTDVGDITLAKGAGNRQISIKQNGTVSINASTSVWAFTFSTKKNDGSSDLGAYGLYGRGDTLTRMYIGTTYTNTWVSVLPSGNVGIGVDSPTSKLHVNGTFNATGNSTIGGTLGVTGAATLSSTLKVAGTTTLQDNVYISNNKYIYYRDKDDTSYKDVFRLNSNNRLIIGYGIRTLADSYTSIYAGASGMKFFTNGTTERMIITASGLVGIGSTDETIFITEKLNVKGNIKADTSDGTFIQIGGARIAWDNSNNALKVYKLDANDNEVATNLYATGAVSAFGIGSSSSGLSLCAPLNNINTNINDNPTTNGATFVWNGNTSKFVYSNTIGQTLTAYNFSAYTGSFGSTLKAADMTVTGGNLTVQTGNLTVTAGRAGIAGATSSSYTLYVHGNIRSNYLAIGATETVNSLSCATIKTLSRQGLSVQTDGNEACYTNVAWSVSSDIRLKNIITNAGASIDQIADAPIFNFRWKSGSQDTILGSSAQYWQTVFPCAVRGDMNSFLSMDYGGVALAAAVITARKVVDHEQRIRQLEIENEELKKKLKQLKAA